MLESVEEWQVCGEAKNGVDAVEKHYHVQPDTTVMDFNMAGLNGLLASREILRKYPDATILMLTGFDSQMLAARAKTEGIRGFCSKTQPEYIIDALQRAGGGHWLPQDIQSRKQTLRKAQIEISRQLERLTEAYLISIIPLAEYQRRRSELEQKATPWRRKRKN